VHKFNNLTKASVLAAVVLLGHPDTARAQNLTFTPATLGFTISGPGGTSGPMSVAVSSTATITSLLISSINTSDRTNWLCAVVSGTNTVNVSVGSGACGFTPTTSQLAFNQTYSGTIGVQGNGGALVGTINVNLTVGNTGGGGSGVAAFPSSITFNATQGGQVNAQNVQVTVNGSATSITSFLFTPTSGVAFLNTILNGSTATLSVNNTNLSNGTYTGTLALNTIFGSVNVFVTLTIGAGGSSGVVATPSSVSFVAAAGGQAGSQNVSVTVNGAVTSINGFSFTPTSGGVSFVTTVINGSTATLSVNNTNLSNGVYTGIETLNTLFGSATVQVTLTIGSGTANLVATPNPVSFTIPLGGGSPPAQSVSILFNGVPANISTVTAVTNNGRNWLVPSVTATAGVVSVFVDAALVLPGSQSGTVTVNTLQGTTTFQVNVVVGATPTLQVNQAALNFAYQIGTNIPIPQTVLVTSSGAAINYSVSSFVNSGTSWLIVSPQGQGQTPGSLTVSVQPAGLQAGVTYSGTIQISTFGGSTNSIVNIPVNLLVSNNPILTATPSSLTFTVQQGSTPPSQILTLQSSSSQLTFNVSSSVSTPAGFNWLQVPTQFGATPGSVPVNIIASGLASGTYNGTITITSQNAGNSIVTVPVTLVVTSGSVLQLSPGALSFNYQIGQSQPQGQTVIVSSPGGQVGYTVSAQVSAGTNWLNVSSTSGVAPGSFVVGVSTFGLTAGAYSGTITVTPGNGVPQTLPVTLVVSSTGLFVASPSTVSFSAQATSTGSATVTPSSQNVAVTTTDGTTISFNVGVTYSSGGAGWLFVNTSTGLTPSNLLLIPSASNLGVGTYTATITLTATSPVPGPINSQTIIVTLVVSANLTLAASPTALSYTQTFNSAPPPAQTLTITSGSSPLTFSAIATTFQGGSWISINPANGSTPATLAVSVNGIVNGFPLQPGTYQGQITISSPGLAAQTVNVTMTVSSTGGGGGGLTGAGSMAQVASAGLWKTIFTLVNTGTVTSQARLNFFDDNGNPLLLPLTFPQTSPFAQSPVASVDRALGPGATLIIESTGPDTQPVQIGWAQLLTSGNITGYAVFRQSISAFDTREAVVPVETRTAGSYVLTFDNTLGFVTGVAVVNTGTQGAFITVTIRDDNGIMLQSGTVPLTALGHTSFNLTDRFPVTAQRRGTVEFQTPAGGGISVLGLRFNPAGAFSTIPLLAK